jgi:hypothetical protein
MDRAAIGFSGDLVLSAVRHSRTTAVIALGSSGRPGLTTTPAPTGRAREITRHCCVCETGAASVEIFSSRRAPGSMVGCTVDPGSWAAQESVSLATWHYRRSAHSRIDRRDRVGIER